MERAVRNEKWLGITCDDCPAILRISYEDSERYGAAIIFVVLIGTAFSIALNSARQIMPTLFVVTSSLIFVAVCAVYAYDSRKLVVIGMRPVCEYCGAIMETENAVFCPSCGSSLRKREQITPREEQQIEIPATQRIGTCMVCNLGLRTGDALAWCPHCGNPAHWQHLMEWVHVRTKCPKCGEHLDEREINLRTTKRALTEHKQRRIWKTI